MGQSSTHASQATVEATVIDSELLDESLLRRLLVRAGRSLASPALEALELLLDPGTPSPVRLTMLAGLSYLLMPADLIPDIFPVAGFSDDLVALTAVIGVWRNHLTPTIQARAQRRLDQWFPLTR
jgi:uncharacterized membrane protein YkvA (DUF1232 family)